MTGRIPSQLKPKVERTCLCGIVFNTGYGNKIHCSRKCADKFNPSRKWFNSRGYKYKQNYGISIEDYNKLFAEQNGCCKICEIHQSELKINLCVDHDHSTGKIRGLLCSKCNQALGLLNDDPEIIAAAKEYVLSQGRS